MEIKNIKKERKKLHFDVRIFLLIHNSKFEDQVAK